MLSCMNLMVIVQKQKPPKFLKVWVFYMKKLYNSNYSSFELQRAQQVAIQNAQYRKQQSHIAHMMKFMERFRYKASKAKQAQSRLKAIEKIEKVAPLYEGSPFYFEFRKPER